MIVVVSTQCVWSAPGMHVLVFRLPRTSEICAMDLLLYVLAMCVRQVLMFRLLIQFTRGNPTLARRPVLVSALRESKKIVQVQCDDFGRDNAFPPLVFFFTFACVL